VDEPQSAEAVRTENDRAHGQRIPELSVRDGYLPPRDLPQGECILTRLEDGRLHIDRADPRIVISAELLNEAVRQPADGVSVNWPPGCFWLTGSTLRIEGVNRTVVYRIGERIPAVNGYIAEWPD
jgi:hypothetical protein